MAGACEYVQKHVGPYKRSALRFIYKCFQYFCLPNPWQLGTKCSCFYMNAIVCTQAGFGKSLALSIFPIMAACELKLEQGMYPSSVTQEIAQTAARMVVEEGLEWGPAKRRAVKQLGLPARTSLPDNEVVEAAVREYIELFCAETQPQELRALRELALTWMERLQEFRPHLSGAVWRGTATRMSDIYIGLFCDDSKSAEIALINHNVQYDVTEVVGFNGEVVDALSISSLCQPLGETIGVHLMVYDYDDLRGALKADVQGRTQRGDTQALRQLLQMEDAQ